MNWYDNEAIPDDVTVAQLDELCVAVSEQRKVCDAISEQSKLENAKLTKLEEKVLVLFEKLGKDSYNSPVGNFSISHRMSVRIPQGEERGKFFAYLQDRGIFTDMITVNHQTLNSFYRAEFEAAKTRGEGQEFSLPGIGEPNIARILSFRKG
jgi:hypothetical protein